MQGLDDKNFDPDELLDQQHQWENKHPDNATKQPQSH
jgi:phospholipid-binding lipoprotein MlaA